MSKNNVLMIKIPPSGSMRYFMLSFLNSVLFPKLSYRQVSVKDDMIIVKTYPLSIEKALSNVLKDSLLQVHELGKKRRGFKDIPLSGNEKKTIRKLAKKLNLPAAQFTVINAIDLMAKYLDQGVYDVNRLNKELSRFDRGYPGDISCPSIFKMEFYSLSRAPYFTGLYRYNITLNLSSLVFLSIGYFMSKIGLSFIMPGKVLSIHALPIRPSSPGIRFNMLIERLRDNVPPALKPEEDLILWLALTAPDYEEDIIIAGISEAAGQKTSTIGLELYVPLRAYITRANSIGILDKLLRRRVTLFQFLKLCMKSYVDPEYFTKRRYRRDIKPDRYSLDDAHAMQERGLTLSIGKLLFLASQGDENAKNEMFLKISRRILSKGEKEVLELYKDLLKIF